MLGLSDTVVACALRQAGQQLPQRRVLPRHDRQRLRLSCRRAGRQDQAAGRSGDGHRRRQVQQAGVFINEIAFWEGGRVNQKVTQSDLRGV